MGDVVPYGLIGQKWEFSGGESGSFGKPLGPEQGTPDPNQTRPRIQWFEHGVIAWCPDQGPEMLVTGKNVEYHASPVSPDGTPLSPYWVERRRGGYALFEWGLTDPFNYDRFIVRWRIAPDPNWHQADVDQGHRNFGIFGPVGWPPPGVDYGTSHATIEFIVEGYDNDGHSRQGWTTPVSLDLF